MPTDLPKGPAEEPQETTSATTPLRFSFDLTAAAAERTRLLDLVPYPCVRGYLWLRGWVAVGLAGLERSFKYLLLSLVSFLAGYATYTTDYAQHLRAYWDAPAVVAADAPPVAPPAIFDELPPTVERVPPVASVAPPIAPVAVPPEPSPVPAPERAPVAVVPAAPVSAAAAPSTARDPKLPLRSFNRKPGTATAPLIVAEPAPPVDTHYDLRPLNERMLEQRQLAAAADQKILYYFSAEWCLPCRVMESEVFSDPLIARTLRERFLFVKLDAESLDGFEYKQHFGIQSLPGFVIMDRYGRQLQRASAGMSLSQFQQFLGVPPGSRAQL